MGRASRALFVVFLLLLHQLLWDCSHRSGLPCEWNVDADCDDDIFVLSHSSTDGDRAIEIACM